MEAPEKKISMKYHFTELLLPKKKKNFSSIEVFFFFNEPDRA